MLVVLATPRSGSETFYFELQEERPAPEWLHLHETLNKGPVEPSFNQLTTNPKTTVKVFPRYNDIKHRDMVQRVLTVADEIIYLVRYDFENQAQSYYLANHTNRWGNRTEVQTINNVDEEKYYKCTQELLEMFYESEKLYNEYPGKVIALEDREYNPYPKKDIVAGTWPSLNTQKEQFYEFAIKSNLYGVNIHHLN